MLKIHPLDTTCYYRNIDYFFSRPKLNSLTDPELFKCVQRFHRYSIITYIYLANIRIQEGSDDFNYTLSTTYISIFFWATYLYLIYNFIITEKISVFIESHIPDVKASSHWSITRHVLWLINIQRLTHVLVFSNWLPILIQKQILKYFKNQICYYNLDRNNSCYV